MSSKIKLDYLQILDKDFSVKPNGYDAKEVDSFLDTIIEDYKAYEEINNQFIMLQKANNNLRKKNNDLELEVETLKSKAKDITTSGEVDFNNVELLKKISYLEEQVYNLEEQLRKAKEGKEEKIDPDNRYESRGKSMLALSEMIVVFVLI